MWKCNKHKKRESNIKHDKVRLAFFIYSWERILLHHVCVRRCAQTVSTLFNNEISSGFWWILPSSLYKQPQVNISEGRWSGFTGPLRLKLSVCCLHETIEASNKHHHQSHTAAELSTFSCSRIVEGKLKSCGLPVLFHGNPEWRETIPQDKGLDYSCRVYWPVVEPLHGSTSHYRALL